jgi:hypothetical protein
MLKAKLTSRNKNIAVSIALLAAALVAMGCHKKAAPAGTATESSSVTNAAEGELANGPVAPPEPPQPPPREVLARADDKAHQAVVGEVDAFLTAQLRAFIQQKNRMPASFSEFTRARLDTVPRPPAGKKWVIDTESLEVKAVAQ